jgi:phenylacetate-coenzyme A ligase PaaK-like adenylate-forming protein
LSLETNIHKRIFAIKEESEFNELALEVFQYQLKHCVVYREYCSLLKIDSAAIQSYQDIPFLPIELFKTHQILSDEKHTQLVFESSGTSGSINSKHYIADETLYKESFIQSFVNSYGALEDWHILALLPSYIEKGNASLVYMCKELMRLTNSELSQFYLHDMASLASTLKDLNEANNRKTLLIGVSYALLDFAESFPQSLENITIMETGGMKGRRKELTKKELHDTLKAAFHVSQIHSEYGMTELLSQAYSNGAGIYTPPAWMKIIVTDIYDPFEKNESLSTGRMNIIDLANIYSCSFIGTSDMGKSYADDSFEIIGRIDNAALRGCNLMIE